MRTLIVNADDFGMSTAINRGIARAHREGVVTSTSVMVRWPEAQEVARYAKACPNLSFGLHCDLGEWVLLDGEWKAVYEVVPLDNPAAVRGEIYRQVEHFHRFAGRLPTHMDSHQHVHQKEPVRSAMLEAGADIGIPVRLCQSAIRYCGSFYGQSAEGAALPDALTVSALIEILQRLPPGVTELGCHPADAVDFQSDYRVERIQELQTLCDPRVRDTIIAADINLISFSDWVDGQGLTHAWCPALRDGRRSV